MAFVVARVPSILQTEWALDPMTPIDLGWDHPVFTVVIALIIVSHVRLHQRSLQFASLLLDLERRNERLSGRRLKKRPGETKHLSQHRHHLSTERSSPCRRVEDRHARPARESTARSCSPARQRRVPQDAPAVDQDRCAAQARGLRPRVADRTDSHGLRLKFSGPLVDWPALLSSDGPWP